MRGLMTSSGYLPATVALLAMVYVRSAVYLTHRVDRILDGRASGTGPPIVRFSCTVRPRVARQR